MGVTNTLMPMSFFRLHTTPLVLLCTVLLSISVLCAQNLQFHVHSLDHGPVDHHAGSLLLDDDGHGHIAIKHLSIDTSHDDHHAGVIVEMSASPDSIVQQSPASLASPELLALLFVLLMLGAYRISTCAVGRIAPVRRLRRCYLLPLLRAPPC